KGGKGKKTPDSATLKLAIHLAGAESVNEVLYVEAWGEQAGHLKQKLAQGDLISIAGATHIPAGQNYSTSRLPYHLRVKGTVGVNVIVQKLDALPWPNAGMVQDTQAVILDFEFHAEEAEKLAKSLWFLPAVEVEVLFSSTQKYTVRRCGFQITHAKFLTSTASQGITLRQGTIVDCARLPEMDDDTWWLHLYVMFSRVTKLDDLLLFRPPPRDVLER
ncbi:unnamed protein product, partial [Effrenium voratum]